MRDLREGEYSAIRPHLHNFKVSAQEENLKNQPLKKQQVHGENISIKIEFIYLNYDFYNCTDEHQLSIELKNCLTCANIICIDR